MRTPFPSANLMMSEKIIAQNLNRGTDNPPGFTMVRNGTVWELTLSMQHQQGHSTGVIREVFHVQTRN